MGKIFYIMGKSSSGKDTLFKQIKETLPELKTVVPYTTRPIREGESVGVEYHFVNDVECENIVKSGRMIELRAYDTIHGIWKYFTADDGQIELEKNSYICIGTLESFAQMRKYYGDKKVIPIYIEVEDGERLLRAISREKEEKAPRYEELCRRFLADSKDFSEENLGNAGVKMRFLNRSLEQVLREILLYIQGEL